MILLIPIILLIIPIGLQSYFGKDMMKAGKMRFALFSIGNVILMIAMVLAGMLISLKGQQLKGISSLSPGFLAFGFIGLFLLLVYIAVQVYRKSG